MDRSTHTAYTKPWQLLACWAAASGAKVTKYQELFIKSYVVGTHSNDYQQHRIWKRTQRF